MASTDSTRKQTFLYRYYDDEGLLLYVGVSLFALARLNQHRDEKEWFRHIRRIELQPFPTRRAALRAERLAIKNEAPFYNKAGVYIPKVKPRRTMPVFDGEAAVYPQEIAATLKVGIEYIIDCICSDQIPHRVDEQRRVYCVGGAVNAWLMS